MKPQLTPTLDEFSQLADRANVIPLFAEFVADSETPVSAFKNLDRGGYSFLFESTEKNDVSGRFSFVGVEPRVIIQSYGRQIRVVDRDTEKRFDTATDPLDEIRKLMARYRFVSHPELPRFAGGAVGFLGYEAINFFEPKVPVANHDDLHLPEVLFMITSSLLIFDHQLRSLKIVVNAFLEDGPTDEVYTRAAESAGAIMRQLARPAHLPFIPNAKCRPLAAISGVRSLSARCNKPKSTSALAISSKSSCLSVSNPISSVIRSIFIGVSVSSIPRRTCFVLKPAMILRSLGARQRCMSGWLAKRLRFAPSQGHARGARPQHKTNAMPPTCSSIPRNAPNTLCLSILRAMMLEGLQN